MKLFEIPVYALSPEKLNDRFNKKKARILNQCTSKNAALEITSLAIENETYPQRLWLYNHIVAYITIFKENSDIVFRQYVPHKTINRYVWTSTVKKFFRNDMSTDYHFRITAEMTSTSIQARIHEYLEEMSLSFLVKGWFIDREAFDAVDRIIDYSRL